MFYYWKNDDVQQLSDEQLSAQLAALEKPSALNLNRLLRYSVLSAVSGAFTAGFAAAMTIAFWGSATTIALVTTPVFLGIAGGIGAVLGGLGYRNEEKEALAGRKMEITDMQQERQKEKNRATGKEPTATPAPAVKAAEKKSSLWEYGAVALIGGLFSSLGAHSLYQGLSIIALTGAMAGTFSFLGMGALFTVMGVSALSIPVKEALYQRRQAKAVASENLKRGIVSVNKVLSGKTDAEISARLQTLYARSGKKGLFHNAGRVASLLAGGAVVSGGAAFAFGLTAAAFFATPVLPILMAGLTVAGAWTGLSAYSILFEGAGSNASGSKEIANLREELSRRKKSVAEKTLPPTTPPAAATPVQKQPEAKTGENIMTDSPTPAVEKKADPLAEVLTAAADTATKAHTDALDKTMAAIEAKKKAEEAVAEAAKAEAEATAARDRARALKPALPPEENTYLAKKTEEETRLAAQKAEELAKIKAIHTREFGDIFNALANAPRINCNGFAFEEVSITANSGEGAKTITCIYFGSPVLRDVLEEQKLERTAEERAANYKILSAAPQFRVATSKNGVEIGVARQGRMESKAFPKKGGSPSAEDFSEARKALGEWLAATAPELVGKVKAAPAKPSEP